MLNSPIVGMHFRPPAKQVLAALPAGARLWLVPEPENPYDSAAIKVFCQTEDIPEEQREGLAIALDGTGIELEELLKQGQIQLGYIISASNKKLGQWASNLDVGRMMEKGEVEAWLTFVPDGGPLARVSLVRKEKNSNE